MNMEVEMLRNLPGEILSNYLEDGDAHIVTDILIEAELRGRATHGLIRLPGIVERCDSIGRQPMLLAKEGEAYSLVDGQDNLGYLVAHRCARSVVGKADSSGIGVVGAFNTGHCGMLGYYASMIADAGLVGLVMCDTSPRIVPWGGIEPVLGTNPIAAGFPHKNGQVLVDLSLAAITNGEILMAMKDGEEIPEGTALGPDGRITTDPEEARKGGALPFGGHKGYALGVMVQILSGVMLQASPVPRPGKNYGIFMLAIDPSIFGESDQFLSGVGELVTHLKSSTRAEGVQEILVPGERAFRERSMRLQEGIEVDKDLLLKLRGMAG